MIQRNFFSHFDYYINFNCITEFRLFQNNGRLHNRIYIPRIIWKVFITALLIENGIYLKRVGAKVHFPDEPTGGEQANMKDKQTKERFRKFGLSYGGCIMCPRTGIKSNVNNAFLFRNTFRASKLCI